MVKGQFQSGLIIIILIFSIMFLFYLILSSYKPTPGFSECCKVMCEDEEENYHKIGYIEGGTLCMCKDKSGSIRDYEINKEICEKKLLSDKNE